MKPHFEILPAEQREIYPYLKQIKNLGFTLFGGTALALQLGHRISVDFDFFTNKDISQLHSLLLNLEQIKVAEITQQTPNALSYKNEKGVKFSFFGTIKFVELTNKIQTDDGVLELADLNALLITKLKATCDRAEYKDYKDIIHILKTRKISLKQGLSGVKEFFGDQFPIINIAKGLTYFEDGDLYRLDNEEKRFLCEVVNNLNNGAYF